MIINETKDRQLVEHIVSNDRIYHLAGHSGDPKDFKADMNQIWLLASYNDKTIGLFNLRYFNKITYDCHVHILPEYQATGKSVIAAEAAKVYIRHHFPYCQSLFTTVPVQCIHVHKYMAKLQFKVSGNIPDGIIYDNKLQDLILYTLKLRGQ